MPLVTKPEVGKKSEKCGKIWKVVLLINKTTMMVWLVTLKTELKRWLNGKRKLWNFWQGWIRCTCRYCWWVWNRNCRDPCGSSYTVISCNTRRGTATRCTWQVHRTFPIWCWRRTCLSTGPWHTVHSEWYWTVSNGDSTRASTRIRTSKCGNLTGRYSCSSNGAIHTHPQPGNTELTGFTEHWSKHPPMSATCGSIAVTIGHSAPVIFHPGKQVEYWKNSGVQVMPAKVKSWSGNFQNGETLSQETTWPNWTSAEDNYSGALSSWTGSL